MVRSCFVLRDRWALCTDPEKPVRRSQFCDSTKMFQVQCSPSRYVHSFRHGTVQDAHQPGPEIIPVGPPGVPPPKIANNGDNDAAPDSQPSQFILLRGLESSVTEELLAKGVAKLYRPTAGNNDAPTSASQKKGAKVASTTGDSNLGAREGSIRRVLLVRDRKTNESWRFGFAEFANVLVRKVVFFFTFQS